MSFRKKTDSFWKNSIKYSDFECLKVISEKKNKQTLKLKMKNNQKVVKQTDTKKNRNIFLFAQRFSCFK